MINRVRQFWRAVRAKVTLEQLNYARQRLSPAEMRLWEAQTTGDRAHSLNTARTAAELAAKRGDIDVDLAVRAALLHDIGRGKAGSPLGKSLAVILHRWRPEAARKLADDAAKRLADGADEARLGFVADCCYRYYYHPQIGAAMLEKSGDPRLAAIVRRHHAAPEKNDLPELTLLRQADEMN